MKDSLKRAWVALHRTPHLSSNVFRQLIIAIADPEHIFSLSPQELTKLNVPTNVQQALTHYNKLKDKKRLQQLEYDYRLLDNLQVDVIPLTSGSYPELLKQISDPPPLLYVRGNSSILDSPQLGMVGSRKPTPQGRENAFRLSKELASAGFTITSGLALGIDTQSHKGALAASSNTVAVLGTGIDRIYPASNRELYQQILTSGVIVTEFPLGSQPRREHFPQRNRVVSGLSLGVLVVEAAVKSGSLISARCALEQNREVFAVPGSINNPVSKGCNALIRQGAKLVETVNDIVEEFKGWIPSSAVQRDQLIIKKPLVSRNLLEPDEHVLLEILGYDPASIDILLSRSGWPVSILSGKLAALEVKGLIKNIGGIYHKID